MNESDASLEPSGEISTEPIVNFFHRRLPEMLVASYVLLLVYCCFIPFEFGFVQREGLGLPLLGLFVRPISLPDIVFNIGAYGPVGAGLFLISRRRSHGRVSAAILSVASGLVMSFLVEQGQVYDYVRVPSWIDVVSNGLGTALGVIAGLMGESTVRRGIKRCRSMAAKNWWLGAGTVFACVVLAVQLRPYDVVPDARHAVKYAIQQGDAWPHSHWERMPARLERDMQAGRRSPSDLSRMQWDYALERVVDVVLYAGLAALLVVGLGRAGIRSTSAMVSAGLCVTGVAGLVTLIRIVLISYGLDTATLACGMVGWAIGSAVGTYALHSHRRRVASERLGSMVFLWPTPVSTAVLFVVCGATLVYGLAPFEFESPDSVMTAMDQRGCLIPFVGHFGQRANDAFLNISTDLLRFLAVGVVLAIASTGTREESWRRRTSGIVLAVVAVTMVLEVVHIWMPVRHMDITHVLLAGIGAFFGAVALRWTHDFRRSISVVHSDDMLTSRLVEGETYEALPVRAPRSPRAGVSPTDQEQSSL